MQNIGFIGTGNMAKAIIKSIYKKDVYKIYGFDINKNNYDFLKELGVTLCSSYEELLKYCRYIVIAVKPQDYCELLKKIKKLVTQQNVFISIAAGINEKYVSGFFDFNIKFIQVMPNTAVLIGHGAVAIARGENVDDIEFNFAKGIFEKSSTVCEIAKDKMNAAVALNGSSPAFIYYYAKGFLDFAEENGIEKKKAIDLFCNSLIGSAKMILYSDKNIDELIDQVSSKKGTTIEGLKVFKKNDFLKIIEKALDATKKRAIELSNF